MSGTTDEDLATAFRNLQNLIVARVRAEQLRDQLTSLSNLAALNDAIRSQIQNDASFWVAFVEVDKFKSVNDRFGYASADALLKKIAETLRLTCSFFPGTTNAFRAHGDEFYLMGTGADAAAIAEKVVLVNQMVAAINIEVEKAGRMTCTVSIGWLVNSDLQEIQTDRTIMAALELAAAEAKRTRNCAVRYTHDLKSDDTISLRADCPCGCKFSLDLKRSANKDRQLACPNCAGDVTRPPLPSIVPQKPPTEVV